MRALCADGTTGDSKFDNPSIDRSNSDVNHLLGACSCACFNVIHSAKESLGASYRVMTILIWPKHLVVIEIASIEQIEADTFEAAIPSFRRSAGPTIRVVGQQSVPQRVTVVVESDHAIGHEDMVSGEAFAGDDALSIKSGKGCLLQKHSGENGARPVSEEDAVRQGPAPYRVLLYARLQGVQVRRTILIESEPMSVVDDHRDVNQMPSKERHNRALLEA